MTSRMRVLVSAFSALLVVLVGISSAFGQVTAGQITGTITDASGAIVPGAKVAVTNEDTGVSDTTTSNSGGNYAVPLLQPGRYRVQVEKEGFRGMSRVDIALHVSEVARLDFRMEIGSASSTVTVVAGGELLETSQSSLGTVIDNRQTLELPSVDRNTFDLALTAPGAYEYTRPNNYGNDIPTANLSINGGAGGANEVLLDGVPDTVPQWNQYAIIPPPDAIQEFNVQTSNLPAEFGRTAGGVINVSMRSGTNKFNGVVYEFARNGALDANQWFSDHLGQPKSPYNRNDFGFQIGGPIRKDKTFFFANYEGLRQLLSYNVLMSVPTLAERAGDFSADFAQNGALQTIYNPYSTTLVAGVYQRTPFQNNQISSSLFNPVSLPLLQYLPKPNLPGNALTNANNFLTNAQENDSSDQYTIRMDEQLGSKDHMYARFSRNKSTQIPPNLYGNIANPSSGPHVYTQQNIAFDDVHTFTSQTLGTLRAGLVRLHDHSDIFGRGFDPSTLGFAGNINLAQPNLSLPSITMAGYTVSNIGFGTGTLGPVLNAIFDNFSTQYTFQGDVTHVWGNHIVKAGGDLRLLRNDGFRPYVPTFSFSAGFTQGPNANTASAVAGNSFASFLLGQPASGSAQNDAKTDESAVYSAGFIQDDYKLTHKLTLNLGFRVEAETFNVDRHNRLTTLNFSSPSPLQVTGLPQLKGGLNFVGVDGQPREQASTPIAYEPRLGFAYAVNSGTVVRGAYGIIAPPRALGTQGLGQIGFSSTTPYIGSYDGVTPIGSWTSPFPNGYIAPTGSSHGLLTNVGGDITSVEYHQKLVYIQQWNTGVQQSLGWNTVLDIGYVGSKSTHLTRNIVYDQLPDSDLALGSALIQSVSNPFYGIIPTTQSLGSPTVQAGQLLRPFPQFTSFNSHGTTSGSAIYHSLQVRVQKRMTNGLQFLASYTFSKEIDDINESGTYFNATTYQDNNNLKLERAVSPFQGAHLMTIAATYQLPIGRGKWILPKPSRAVSVFVSGWEVNMTSNFQSGVPLPLTATNNSHSFGGGERPNVTGATPSTTGRVQNRLNSYINTAAYSQPAPYTFGNAPRVSSNLLAPGSSTFNLSADKSFQMNDRFRLQFRAEAFNALNHPAFGAPGTALGSTTFGVISSANSMRILQLALKLYF